METLPVKRLKLSERFCPHCKQVLSFKTFQAHKRIYYNAETGDWIDKGILSRNLVDHDKDDENDSTDKDSPPASDTEMDQYPIIEIPPVVDPAIPSDRDDDGMLFKCAFNDKHMHYRYITETIRNIILLIVLSTVYIFIAI